jgi:hypothetical protein
MRIDGFVVRLASDGQEEPLFVPAIPSKSEAEIEAAVASDTANPPITPERRTRLRPVSRGQGRCAIAQRPN